MSYFAGIKMSSIINQATSTKSTNNTDTVMMQKSTTSNCVRVLSPRASGLKIRKTQHRNSSVINVLSNSVKKQHINQNNNNNNNGENHEQNVINLCSPPSLDGKDVEHMRRFELEI